MQSEVDKYQGLRDAVKNGHYKKTVMTTRFAPLFLILATLTACTEPAPNKEQTSTTDAAPKSSLEQRIEGIENSVMPSLQITGREVPTYNIDERLEELGIPGLSVAFAVDGEIQWARAYGMADVAEGRKMTPDTMLLAGSISKPVAALRALQMVEAGTFDLDENINSYLTSWQVADNEFTEIEKVNLRRILNHTAGLTVWGFPGYDKGDEIPSTVDVLDGKGNTDAVTVYKTPGEGWQYSGGGYTIMQLAITDNQSEGFVQSLQTHVLDPLGMQKSTFANPLPEAMHGIAATGYRDNGDEVEGKWPIYPEMAAAGLWTTASQLVRYGTEIQRILRTGEDGILSHEMVVQMLDAEPDAHGLGPSIQEHTFGHGGADEGFRAQLLAWKDLPFAVVIMVNSDNGSIIRELLLAIANEYELPGIAPVVRTIEPLTSEQLAPFVGRYNMNGDIYDTNVDGESVVINGVGFDFTDRLLPQSTTELFSESSGTVLSFTIEGDIAISFTVFGQTAVRFQEQPE